MSLIKGRSSRSWDYQIKPVSDRRGRRSCKEPGCEATIKSTNKTGYCGAHLRTGWRSQRYRPPVSEPVDPDEARRYEVEHDSSS